LTSIFYAEFATALRKEGLEGEI